MTTIQTYEDESFQNPDVEITEDEFELLRNSLIGSEEIEFRGENGVVERMLNQTHPHDSKIHQVYFELVKRV